jgi:hypothetical protein
MVSKANINIQIKGPDPINPAYIPSNQTREIDRARAIDITGWSASSDQDPMVQKALVYESGAGFYPS